MLLGVEVGFDPEVYVVLETDRAINLIIRRFTPSALPVSVMFSTLNGTAMGKCSVVHMSIIQGHVRVGTLFVWPTSKLLSVQFTIRVAENISSLKPCIHVSTMLFLKIDTCCTRQSAHV